MMQRFAASVFGWSVRPPEVKPAAVEPLKPPQRDLPALLGITSLEDAGTLSDGRVQCGLSPGAVMEIRNSDGIVTDYRRKSYRSNIEAGVDYLIAEMPEGPDKNEARRLQPLGALYALRRALAELDDSRPPQTRTEAPQRAVSDTVPESAPKVVWNLDAMLAPGYDARQLRERRGQVEAGRRTAEQQRFDMREQAKVDALRRVDVSDTTTERVRIEAAVRAWHAANPELAREIAAADALQ